MHMPGPAFCVTLVRACTVCKHENARTSSRQRTFSCSRCCVSSSKAARLSIRPSRTARSSSPRRRSCSTRLSPYSTACQHSSNLAERLAVREWLLRLVHAVWVISRSRISVQIFGVKRKVILPLFSSSRYDLVFRIRRFHSWSMLCAG
jgi:hypothetical protein